MKLMKFGYILMFLATACTSSTPEEKMMKTSEELVKTIAENDYKGYLQLLRKNDDNYIQKGNFDRMRSAYLKYGKDSMPAPVITDSITPLSTRLVKVQLFNGYDSASDIHEVYINIFMGPPQVVPLSKITDIAYMVRYSPGNPKNIMYQN